MSKKEKFEINKKINTIIWSDIIKIGDDLYFFNAPVSLINNAVETKEYPYLGDSYDEIFVHLESLGLTGEPLYDCDNYFNEASKRFGIKNEDILSYMFGEISEEEVLSDKNLRRALGNGLGHLMLTLGGYINGVNY